MTLTADSSDYVRFESTSGTVKDVPVKVGEIVGSGDIIARLDPATVTNSQIDLFAQQVKDTTDVVLQRELEQSIRSTRSDIAEGRENEAAVDLGPRRVAEISVKPGEKVVAGQLVALLVPVSGKTAAASVPSETLAT